MKYDCPGMMDLLVDLLEGELAEEDEAHLKAHLQGCPPCAAFMESYESTTEVCRAVLAREMPAELRGELLTFLREKTQD